MQPHNENVNKQITHNHFFSSFAPAYPSNNWLMLVWQPLWRDLETWERLSHIFYPWASFNSHSQLPACLYSFHLTVLFGQPSVSKWPYIGLGTLSGALFSRWLTLKNKHRNPQMFPLCLRKGCWDPGSLTPVVCMSCCALRAVGGAGFLTGGAILQEQDQICQSWVGLLLVSFQGLTVCSNDSHIWLDKDKSLIIWLLLQCLRQWIKEKQD